VRGEQVLGTLEAMLVSPTPTSVVIFSSTAWDFTWGGLRLLVYLLCAVFIFGVKLNVASPTALALGVALTLLSSAGIGMPLGVVHPYFKRGDPINFSPDDGHVVLRERLLPLEAPPSPVQWVSEWLPMSWSLQASAARSAEPRSGGRAPDRATGDPDGGAGPLRAFGRPDRHPEGQLAQGHTRPVLSGFFAVY
jgi:hypothetical protein